MFELWPLENRLFDACRTFPEEILEISSFFTTQFPVLTSQNDLESVNFFKKKRFSREFVW